MEGDPKIKRELRAGRSNSGADWESRINSRRTTPRVHLKNCVCPHMSGVNSGCECTLFVWLAIDTEFLVVRMAGWLRTIHKRERTRRLGDLFVVVPAGMSRDGPNLGRRLYVRIDNWLGDRWRREKRIHLSEKKKKKEKKRRASQEMARDPDVWAGPVFWRNTMHPDDGWMPAFCSTRKTPSGV